MRSRRTRGDLPRLLIWIGLALFLLTPSLALGQEATAPTAPVSIALKDSKFDPQAAVGLVNQTVTWANKDGFAHDVTAVDHTWNSTGGPGGFAAGATYSHVFTKPGVYDYYCTLHGSKYKQMWGRVIVVTAEKGVVPGGAAGGANPETIGVRWLAHWVGIISFVAVVAVLVIYYFVLKYGETMHATDHRDRKEK
jgi:plastocyanin